MPGEASQQDIGASIDEEITSLEQVIRDAHTKILNLRAHRNARVSSTARIPTETLAQIFILFEHQYRHELFATSKQLEDAPTRPFGWIVITHVCHHWRSVARALPHLWSHVPMIKNTEAIEMFLELS